MQKLCQVKINNTMRGFSLLEISFVILIIGVISTVAMKGYDILQSAKITATGQELQRIQLAWSQFYERTGKDPDNPPWDDFYKAQLLDYSESPVLKIGGRVRIEKDGSSLRDGFWLVCEGASGGVLLSPNQAQQLKSNMGESGSKANEGNIQFDGTDCVNSDNTLKNSKNVGCTAYIRLSS